MLVRTRTITIKGINPIGVDVEVSTYNRGLPRFDIVGLPAKSVEESKLRVRAAFNSLGYSFPERKITINLAPGDLNKDGTFFDLPIAVGIFAAHNDIKDSPIEFNNSLFYGELSLEGNIRPTKGTFLLALYAHETGIKNLFVSGDAVHEAECFPDLDVYPLSGISELFEFMLGNSKLEKKEKALPVEILNNALYKKEHQEIKTKIPQNYMIDTIVGQNNLKKALLVSLAGRHNMLMTGSPGSGKSMAAKSARELLPKLDRDESIQVTKVYSSVGGITSGSLIEVPPYRDPHHTISYSGLIGGGSFPKPGEISLAHRGILFLDEITEFNRKSLEALRQPLEEGQIVVSRANNSETFPSKFLMIAACNPCPCGYFNDPKRKCTCSPKVIKRYFEKISGPILDRIDIKVWATTFDTRKIGNAFGFGGVEKSFRNRLSGAKMKKLIKKVFKVQKDRFKSSDISYNAEMSNEQVKELCYLDEKALAVISKASVRLSISARSYLKILKISRTIADLNDSENIKSDHVLEALSLRTSHRVEL